MWWTKFKSNLAYAHHYATMWVSAGWSAVFGYWGSLDKEAQQEMLGNFISAHQASILIGVLAFISYVAAKGWPQPKLEQKLEDKHVRDDANLFKDSGVP